MPTVTTDQLEHVAGAARGGSGHRAAAEALELAATLSTDDGARARLLRLAAADAQLGGDPGRARELLATATRYGSDVPAADPRLSTADALARDGSTAAARATLAPLIGRLRHAGALHDLAPALAVWAYAEVQAGDLNAATGIAAEAAALAELTGDRAAAGRAWHTLALAYAIQGADPPCRAATARAGAHQPDPLALLDLGLARYDRTPPRAWTAESVEACVRSGRTPPADVIDRLRRAADRPDTTLRGAVAARLAALTADDGRYDEWFGLALNRHQETQCPFESGRTLLVFGERLRRAGRRTEARTRLRAAIAAFELVGATPWLSRAVHELAATADPAAVADPGGAPPLTPQELQVARTVATGVTNREVAATLFLSTKTVEFHLGNIYRKLGIRNRTQLARHY